MVNSFIFIVIYKFDINLREASILGLIGVGGRGTPLMQVISNQNWNDVGVYLLGLIILILFVEYFYTKLRKKLM